VGRMGDIYSKARCVVVWLGPQSNDSALAIQTLHRIGLDVNLDEVNKTIRARNGTETRLLERDPKAIVAKQDNWAAIRNLF
jgi:Heterokaryon incompatibility protein (HET)